MVTFDEMLKQCVINCEAMDNPNPFLVFTGKGLDSVVGIHKTGGKLIIEQIVDIQLANEEVFILGLNVLEDEKEIHILKYEDFKNIIIVKKEE